MYENTRPAIAIDTQTKAHRKNSHDYYAVINDSLSSETKSPSLVLSPILFVPECFQRKICKNVVYL